MHRNPRTTTSDAKAVDAMQVGSNLFEIACSAWQLIIPSNQPTSGSSVPLHAHGGLENFIPVLRSSIKPLGSLTDNDKPPIGVRTDLHEGHCNR